MIKKIFKFIPYLILIILIIVLFKTITQSDSIIIKKNEIIAAAQVNIKVLRDEIEKEKKKSNTLRAMADSITLKKEMDSKTYEANLKKIDLKYQKQIQLKNKDIIRYKGQVSKKNDPVERIWPSFTLMDKDFHNFKILTYADREKTKTIISGLEGIVINGKIIIKEERQDKERYIKKYYKANKAKKFWRTVGLVLLTVLGISVIS